MSEEMPYLLGALGGGGLLAVYYGFRRVADRKREDRDRRKGLWAINLGMVMVFGSLALSLWFK